MKKSSKCIPQIRSKGNRLEEWVHHRELVVVWGVRCRRRKSERWFRRIRVWQLSSTKHSPSPKFSLMMMMMMMVATLIICNLIYTLGFDRLSIAPTRHNWRVFCKATNCLLLGCCYRYFPWSLSFCLLRSIFYFGVTFGCSDRKEGKMSSNEKFNFSC